MDLSQLDKISLRLLNEQNECVLSWITQDGSPASTVVSFVYYDNALWMTAAAGSARVKALNRDPRASLVVNGSGSEVGHTRCLSLRGRCQLHQDKAVRDVFFPRFSKKVLAKSKMGAGLMSKGMNNSSNYVLQFIPNKAIPYDAQKMIKLADFMP